MAGRLALFNWPNSLASLPGFPEDLAARWNLVPNSTLLIVRQLPELRVDQALWGLTPQWMTDFSKAAPHARIETIAEQPMFKQAYAQRRCAIVANGFFEWRGKVRKQAYWMTQAQPLQFIAGVWEAFNIAGKQYLSVAMLTYQAQQLRRPVILEQQLMKQWLAQDADLENLPERLVAAQPMLLERVVTKQVSDPAFDGPACLMS